MGATLIHTHQMSLIIPTTLSKEQVHAFQKLYFERFKEKINFQEATEKGLSVIRFFVFLLELTDTKSQDGIDLD